MQLRRPQCCFFSTFQKCLAFGGKTSHPWPFTWVPLGDPKPAFPDSGGSAARIGVVRCGSGPCCFWESSPLQITNEPLSLDEHRGQNVVWVRGFMAVSMTAQAQTYYYYPTSVPAAPSVNPVATVAPTGYCKGLTGNQVVWYTYTPQYLSDCVYDTDTSRRTYTPQYSQPTYQAQSSAGTRSTAQVAPAQYATYAPPRRRRRRRMAGDPYGFLGWLNATRAATACQRSATTPTCRTGRR